MRLFDVLPHAVSQNTPDLTRRYSTNYHDKRKLLVIYENVSYMALLKRKDGFCLQVKMQPDAWGQCDGFIFGADASQVAKGIAAQTPLSAFLLLWKTMNTCAGSPTPPVACGVHCNTR